MRRLRETLEKLKGSLQPVTTPAAIVLFGMLPAAVQAPAIDLLSRRTSLVASNVRGRQRPPYLAGRRIDQLYFWVPQAGSVGVGVSLLSYAGKL